MSNELLTIKASIGEDIRRFSVDPTINFTSLTTLVHQLFNLNEKASYSLLYLDNENDWIKLSTDVELDEAKRFTTKCEDKTLRLQVKLGEASPTEESKEDKSSCPLSNFCEKECSGMKFIGIALFALGFFCRPVLALCFLAGFLLLKRKLFNCGTKRSGNYSCCSWIDCATGVNSACAEKKEKEKEKEKVQEQEQEEEEEEKEKDAAEDLKPNSKLFNWQLLLKQLHEMGFTNVKQNVQLLTKHNGNIDNTVAELVQLAQ
jgi:hypothetical protein